jgi:hypothetical protein
LAGCGALLGFVIKFHSYDYISLFVSFIDISVSLGHLFQGITSINDQFYLPRLNKLFEENLIVSLFAFLSNIAFLTLVIARAYLFKPTSMHTKQSAH